MTILTSVFAIATSKFLFKNEIAKSNIIATLVCVVGIVLIAQPTWMFKKMPPSADIATTSFKNASFPLPPLNTFTNYGYSVSSSGVKLGYTLSILGGAAQGVSFEISGIILHDVKTIPKATYTMFICTVGSVGFMFYLEDPVYVIDPISSCLF